MTKAELLKKLRGYKDDVQIVIGADDDSYAEIGSVKRLVSKAGPWPVTTALVLEISDPREV